MAAKTKAAKKKHAPVRAVAAPPVQAGGPPMPPLPAPVLSPRQVARSGRPVAASERQAASHGYSLPGKRG